MWIRFLFFLGWIQLVLVQSNLNPKFVPSTKSKSKASHCCTETNTLVFAFCLSIPKFNSSSKPADWHLLSIDRFSFIKLVLSRSCPVRGEIPKGRYPFFLSFFSSQYLIVVGPICHITILLFLLCHICPIELPVLQPLSRPDHAWNRVLSRFRHFLVIVRCHHCQFW